MVVEVGFTVNAGHRWNTVAGKCIPGMGDLASNQLASQKPMGEGGKKKVARMHAISM